MTFFSIHSKKSNVLVIVYTGQGREVPGFQFFPDFGMPDCICGWKKMILPMATVSPTSLSLRRLEALGLI